MSWIKGLLGFSQVGWIIGILFAFAGAATWLREDGISSSNTQWELRLSQEAAKAHNEVQEKQLVIERLQKKLALKEAEDAAKAEADKVALEKQQADFPLSAECMRCRIPNERLWLRGNQAVAPKSRASDISKAPGS